MAHLVKHLLYNYKDVSLRHRRYGEKSSMVAYARNPSTGEAETSRFLGLTGQPVC